MIRNTRQYRITKAQAEKFALALAEFEESLTQRKGVHPQLIKAQREAMASQLKSLQQELAEYERLRKTRHRQVDPDLVTDLPQALIRARIPAGLSQRELAERIGLQKQQIQRYEATNYETVSLK